jgi:hypothetical protein
MPILRRERSVGRDAVARLTAFTRDFSQHNARTEQDFVELGLTLRRLHSVATELTGLVSERAGALRGALEQSRLAGADGLAARSLQELRATLEESSGLLRSLRAVAGAIQQLDAQVAGIERIGVFLRSAVISFAVESCRTPDCQQAFGAFVEELRALARRIGELSQAISRQVQATQESHARRLSGLSSGFEEMHALAKQLEATAGTTAAQAQQLLDGSSGALREAEERARQIAHHANEAVYHLQFGDIIRQKGEHILAALKEAADLLSGEDPAAESSEKVAAADHVLVIQAGQLESVRQEVLTVQAQLTASFRSIAQETSLLAGTLELGQQALRTQDRAADPLQALTQHSSRLEALQQQGRGLGQQARLTARQAVDASTDLAQHLEQIKSINAEMHLQALNAIIKTAALAGQGATLEVLSCQVDRLYRESSQEVAEIGGTVKVLLGHAQDATPADGPGDSAPSAATGSALRAGLEQIAGAYEEFRKTSAEARDLSQKQQASFEGCGARLEFLGNLAETLGAQLRDLASVRESLAPWKAEQATPPGGTAHTLGQRYTMQSERDIHRRATGMVPLAAVSPVPSDDGKLDLFDAPIAAPETNEPGPQAPPPSGEMKREDPERPVAATVTEPSLGDNIELF